MERKDVTWSPLFHLDKERIEKIPVNSKGVYRLSSKNESDGKYYVFYVGESEDLKKELLNHISDNEENICIKNFVGATKLQCAFRYSIIDELEFRMAFVRMAYNLYQPVCNTSLPDGRDDIEINLL